MTRLKVLKPVLQTLNPDRVKTINSTSWRGAKTSAERGYGYRWQQARLVHLRDNPLCVYCQREGRVTAASVVDHIVAHQGNETLMWDRTNWQSLCKPHHDGQKKREEAGGSRG
jgi:5-methylcytosine-specific restriction endonuclease McrA